MSNKEERDKKEMKSLFEDPKFSRKAWRAVGMAIAASPAQRVFLPDEDGNYASINAAIENYSYTKLKEDIASLGKEDREPTEMELIMQCHAVKSRVDVASAVFFRDTVGAKPIDESKVDQNVTNQYEQMTDEELECLLAFREAKKLEDAKNGVLVEQLEEE